MAKKWFKRLMVPLSGVVHLTADVSDDLIERFFSELERVGISDMSVRTFRDLADMSSALRLAYNLQNLIDILGHKAHVASVLSDGLTEKEYCALYELANRDIDPITCQIAHSLLNIYERHTVLEFLNPLFNRFKTRSKKS